MVKANIAILDELNIDHSAYHGKTIAVHIHLFYQDLIPEFKGYLSNIPVPFDLLLSIPKTVRCKDHDIEEAFSSLENINKVIIKHTTNRGRDIAPMVCTFGKEIMEHDFLLHFHTKKSPHDDTQNGWRTYMLQHIVGSRELVEKILTQLSTFASVVCAPDFLFNVSKDKWGNKQNLPEAQKIIDRSPLNINLKEEYPVIDFPQGSFFWARTDCLTTLFEMNLEYEDFPSEPLPVDGTMAHAMERLIFLWGKDTAYQPLKIYFSETELAFNTHARDTYVAVVDMSEERDAELERLRAKTKKHLKYLRLTGFLSVILLITTIILLTTLFL